MKLNTSVLLKILSILTLVEGLAMLGCAAAGIYFKEERASNALLAIGMTCFALGFLSLNYFKSDSLKLKVKEGYLISCLTWIYCSILGALPMIFCGMGYGIIESFFESVAGFTTTGITAFSIDHMPKCIILWRATLNWIGGMGILVFVVSIFPALGISGQSIAQTETTGPELQKIGARISDTGKFLYITYIVLTLAELILLSLGPFNFFDALTNTFSSISTGGLYVTVHNQAMLQLPYVRGVILVFTILSSLNYTLYYYVLKGNFKVALKNYEMRIFFIIILGATFIVAASLFISGTYSSFWQAIKDSLCQVVSFISTSGYYVCDYTKWPTFTIIILFLLLFIGGCSMSTSGSLKVIRIITLFKLLKRGLFKYIHPNAVKAITIDGKAMPAKKVSNITSHILVYFVIVILSAIVLATNGFDMETTLSTVLSLFTNTGMALGEVGTSGYFGMFNGFSQFVLCFLMIAGRLEIFALILVFTKSFWKSDRANVI